MDTPRPTRPGIGNGLRWSELQADINRSRRDIGIWPLAKPIPINDTIARVDAVINDLDAGHPDSAQVVADMRAAIAATPDGIVTVDGPLTADEAEAIRDLVTAQPGRITDMSQLDDATIAELRASIQRQLASPANITISEPPPPPLTYDQLHDLVRRLGPIDPPPEPIQLTDEQFDQVPKAPPRKPWEPAPSPLLGIPVHRVDTVEESTPYRLERARHIAEQHVELCGCTWDHPANVEPTRPGWLRRAIRRLLR